jgi:hypothetical protein
LRQAAPAEFLAQTRKFLLLREHGVRLVEGSRDPLDSRIAVHSWFYEAELVVREAIKQAGQQRVFEATLAILLVLLGDVGGFEGLVAARIDVSSGGEVTNAQVVSSSLVSRLGDHDAVGEVERKIEDHLANASFPQLPAGAWAVFPVSFPLTKH